MSLIKGKATSYIVKGNSVFIPIGKNIKNLDATFRTAERKKIKLDKMYGASIFGSAIQVNKRPNGTNITINVSDKLVDAIERKIEKDEASQVVESKGLDPFAEDSEVLNQKTDTNGQFVMFDDAIANYTTSYDDYNYQVFRSKKIETRKRLSRKIEILFFLHYNSKEPLLYSQ